jgi:hypothetical protein
MNPLLRISSLFPAFSRISAFNSIMDIDYTYIFEDSNGVFMFLLTFTYRCLIFEVDIKKNKRRRSMIDDDTKPTPVESVLISKRLRKAGEKNSGIKTFTEHDWDLPKGLTEKGLAAAKSLFKKSN